MVAQVTTADLAALLGDTIDRSHYIFRDGAPVVPRREHGHCCWIPREERTNA
jgi:hypothetical protein